VIGFLIFVLTMGYKKGERAFKASSVKAEQALGNIKIVSAYGQEHLEEERFVQHLQEAKETSIRFHFISALGYALNNSAFLLLMSLMLFLGGIFVVENVHNDVRGRNYTGGDVISIFFGVMFGGFGFAIGAPNINAVTKGRQAARCALDVINRKPEILIDDPRSQRLENFEGSIEFKNVSFQYKT
jgi:ABC-type multidrug transport system fused ATPase/permease subunit